MLKRLLIGSTLLFGVAQAIVVNPVNLPQPTFNVVVPNLNPVAIRGTYQIKENGQTLALNCARGASVEVRGNDNRIYLYGNCGELILRGNSNTVYAASVDAIAARGNDNRVVLDDDAPPVDFLTAPGNGNVFVYDWD